MSLSVSSWQVPFQLSTPVGSLDLNSGITLTSGATGIFYLNPQNCEAVIPIRVQDDDIPQADGEQTHERFFKGYVMTLAVQLWANSAAACNEDLTEMADMLSLYVRGFPRTVNDVTGQDGRIYWTPDGANQRMIRRVMLNESLTWSLTDGGTVEATFQVKSMYPYAWDAAETTTALTGTDTLTNTGTAEFWPVIKVYGPTASFSITNPAVVDENGNALSIIYVGAGNPGGAAIGGGSYVEIDTFRNTMYLNGDGANMKPGLDVLESDFFPLAVGANPLTIVGATADVLWQNAWS